MAESMNLKLYIQWNNSLESNGNKINNKWIKICTYVCCFSFDPNCKTLYTYDTTIYIAFVEINYNIIKESTEHLVCLIDFYNMPSIFVDE